MIYPSNTWVKHVYLMQVDPADLPFCSALRPHDDICEQVEVETVLFGSMNHGGVPPKFDGF